MTDERVLPVTLPKWGLAMEEGRIGDWHVAEGDEVVTGMEMVDVETDKIAGAVDAAHSGILRRIVAVQGETLPVGALLGVISGGEVPEDVIDAYVQEFQESSDPVETEEKGNSAPKPENIQVGDLTINYLRQGSSEKTAILLHGFGGDLNNWLFNHPSLASARTVIAVDLPGHGGSTKAVGDGSLIFIADVLRQTMSELGVQEADWVGHSMGGALALQLLKTCPELVRSLTLIAGAGLGPEINAGYLRGFTESRNRRELKPYVQQLFNDPGLITRQLVEELLKYKRIDGVQESLQTILGSFIDGDSQTSVLRNVLADNGIPTLAIWGSRDRILPADHALNLPEAVRVHVLENHGHMVQMEAAMEVNRLIHELWQV